MSVAMRTLKSEDAGFDAALAALLAYPADTDDAIELSVAAIIADVRARGDAAVLELTRRFDGIDAETVAELEIAKAELHAALEIAVAGRRTRRLDAERDQ